MKVLLFTHEQDIDGIGNIILGQQAFEEFDYVPCKTFEINLKVREKILDGSIYYYDFIFVTDLCIKEPLLEQISKDDQLKDKILVLDHHKSEIEEGNNRYDFVHIIVTSDKGMESGTSLFYDYLTKHHFLQPTSFLDEFVELTRQYDTFEWKTKYNNSKARQLHILFETLGYKKYIEILNKMILTQSCVVFDKDSLQIIISFEKKLKEDIETILEKMKVHEEKIDNKIYKIGFVRTPYKYRNDINDIIKENNINDIDVVGLIATDKDSVSYRYVKEVDVSKVAMHFGGKGHKNAASSPTSNPKLVKVLTTLYKNNGK